MIFKKVLSLLIITTTIGLSGCDKSLIKTTSIEITTPPDKTEYIEGESFNPVGMVVTGKSTFGSAEIKDYTYSPTGALNSSDKYITISVGELTAKTPIVVSPTISSKTLENIYVATKPSKVDYKVGELFNPSGMVIKGVYTGALIEIITSYTYTPNGPLTENDKLITISYEGKTTSVKINVTKTTSPTLTSISVSKQPNKTEYQAGEFFDPTGMEIVANYSDGSSTKISNYTYSPDGELSTSHTRITISFSTFTCYVSIKVSGNQDNDFNGYYSTISTSNDSTLLANLRTLNLKKRTSTVGYKDMGTTPAGMFKYTDYDPNSVPANLSGQVYGTKILSFYSGRTTTNWNREHVWPDSRGGGKVESDIYMPRPTIAEENSNRGNSVYYEGKCHSSEGWDPITAFEKTIGVYENIRGECARIVFYCLTASDALVIDDVVKNNKNNMGRLTDLLRWNLEYPVNDRELRRQDGGQYLQGNRNAFVDHPDYACRIWGATNEQTRKICGINE